MMRMFRSVCLLSVLANPHESFNKLNLKHTNETFKYGTGIIEYLPIYNLTIPENIYPIQMLNITCDVSKPLFLFAYKNKVYIINPKDPKNYKSIDIKDEFISMSTYGNLVQILCKDSDDEQKIIELNCVDAYFDNPYNMTVTFLKSRNSGMLIVASNHHFFFTFQHLERKLTIFDKMNKTWLLPINYSTATTVHNFKTFQNKAFIISSNMIFLLDEKNKITFTTPYAISYPNVHLLNATPLSDNLLCIQYLKELNKKREIYIGCTDLLGNIGFNIKTNQQHYEPVLVNNKLICVVHKEKSSY